MSNSPPVTSHAKNAKEPTLPSLKPTSEPTLPPKKKPIERYPPSEESALLSTSNEIKQSGNTLFSSSDYSSAITTYNRAIASLPDYLDYEHAVLRANIAACHVLLKEWKEVVSEAELGLGRLDEYEAEQRSRDEEDAVVRELEEGETVEEGPVVERKRVGKEEVQKIRVKLLLRRGKARMEIGGWAGFNGALEDYTALSRIASLTPTDKKTVDAALRSIPPKLEKAKQAEMGEMMGKLKELGNGLLKPFGLSTDSFSMKQDPATGGYNMSFGQK